ncbi:MAG: hypothetical protein H7239_10345 [Flavobacterium sp.]|nr:hypothetical protein [Flavobacterium sp.]
MTKKQKEILEKIVSKTPCKWIEESNKRFEEKEKYIGTFLDGYFSDKKVEFGMQYYSMLNNAIDIAENKWKQYKKQKL